jgi:hypothetical protein
MPSLAVRPNARFHTSMNDLPNPSTPSTPVAPVADAASEIKSLRGTLNAVLLFSLVIGTSFLLYLVGQEVVLIKGLGEAQRLIDDYNTNAVPTVKALQADLEKYALRDPNVLPILQKYGMASGKPAAPSPAPAPAPMPPAKR